MKELSSCFRWLEDGKPVEHFLEMIHVKPVEHFLKMIHVKRTDTESITSAITSYLQEKQIDIRLMQGMGFDGDATFSGRRTGVQARLRTLSPLQSLFTVEITYCS